MNLVITVCKEVFESGWWKQEWSALNEIRRARMKMNWYGDKDSSILGNVACCLVTKIHQPPPPCPFPMRKWSCCETNSHISDRFCDFYQGVARSRRPQWYSWFCTKAQKSHFVHILLIKSWPRVEIPRIAHHTFPCWLAAHLHGSECCAPQNIRCGNLILSLRILQPPP